MSDRKFDLGDYVEVKDRLAILYELYPTARLVTAKVKVLTAPDGKQRVMVKALAYRTPDDPHPAVGHSWMEIPGTTSYTRGSELENTETSAWGRAIAALGILVDKSIASAQEVQNKQEGPRSGWVSETPFGETTHDEGLIGTAEVGKARDSDFELRQTPDGMALGFKLTNGRKGWKVMTTGPLAEALSVLRPSVEGQRITVWGTMADETFTPKGSTKSVTYQVVHAERIQTPDGTIPPLPASDELTDEEKALIGGSLPDEAPSEELFPAEVGA